MGDVLERKTFFSKDLYLQITFHLTIWKGSSCATGNTVFWKLFWAQRMLRNCQYTSKYTVFIYIEMEGEGRKPLSRVLRRSVQDQGSSWWIYMKRLCTPLWHHLRKQWWLGFNFPAFTWEKLIKNANATDKIKSCKSYHLAANLSAIDLYAWHNWATGFSCLCYPHGVYCR